MNPAGTESLSLVELAVTTGTAVKAGVGPGRKFQITPLGVRFCGRMTYDQWMDGLRAWKLIRQAWDFGLADYLHYGRTEFGDEQVNSAFNQLQFDMQDMARAYAIGQTLLEFRSPQLSSEHYYVLGTAIDPGDDAERTRARWAAIAEKHELSALELKKSIEAGKVIKQESVNAESGRNAGIANMQGLKFWFERWEKQAGGHEAILDWPEDRKKNWLEEMKPLIGLGIEMAESLGFSGEMTLEEFRSQIERMRAEEGR